MREIEVRNTDTEVLDTKVRIIEEFTSEYARNRLIHGELFDGKEVTLKFSRIPSGARREWEGLSLAFSYNVRVPEPIAFVERDDEPSKGFIMGRITGSSLKVSKTKDSKFNLGRELSKLHEINLLGYGTISRGQAEFEKMEEYVGFWLDRTFPYLDKYSEVKNLLIDLYDTSKSRILSQSPKFIHRDINDNNILVKEDSSISIIDFEWWQGGDPLEDLAIYLYHSIRVGYSQEDYLDFLRGYSDKLFSTSLEKASLFFYLVLAASRIVGFSSRTNIARLDEAERDLKKVVSFTKENLENFSIEKQ